MILLPAVLADDVERVEDRHAAEMSVPSVRVKRATATLRTTMPMIGELEEHVVDLALAALGAR